MQINHKKYGHWGGWGDCDCYCVVDDVGWLVNEILKL